MSTKIQSLLKLNNMKAKVKGTGEIVDVHPNGEKIIHLKCTNFATGDGRELLDMELDFLPTIDWEQRRYEIAKAALSGVLSSPTLNKVVPLSFMTMCKWSVNLADAIIEELRKRNDNGAATAIQR